MIFYLNEGGYYKIIGYNREISNYQFSFKKIKKSLDVQLRLANIQAVVSLLVPEAVQESNHIRNAEEVAFLGQLLNLGKGLVLGALDRRKAHRTQERVPEDATSRVEDRALDMNHAIDVLVGCGVLSKQLDNGLAERGSLLNTNTGEDDRSVGLRRTINEHGAELAPVLLDDLVQKRKNGVPVAFNAVDVHVVVVGELFQKTGHELVRTIGILVPVSKV